MTDDWTPAFPGQRPPFLPGNTYTPKGNNRARTHGAFSDRAVVPLAHEIADQLKALPELGYLDTNRFADKLWAYALAAARSQLFEEWLATLPMAAATTAKRATAPLEQSRQLAGRAANLGDAIGLSPVISDDVVHEIRLAWGTVNRRQSKQQLKSDLKTAIRDQLERGGRF